MIKENCVYEDDVNFEDIVYFKGIGRSNRCSIGSVNIKMDYYNEKCESNNRLKIKFYVVKEDVIGYYDGIIGNDVLSRMKFSIDLKNNTLYNDEIKIALESRKEPNVTSDYVNKMINREETSKRSTKFCFKDINNRSVKIWNQIRKEHLSDKEMKSLKEIIGKFSDIFSLDDEDLTVTSVINHHIRTTSEVPLNAKTYRYPKIHEEEVNSQIQKLLKNGTIRHSISPWSSPLWVVPKKLDSSGKTKWRMVIDYRRLNEITVSDKFPIPNIQEILDQLDGAKYFTTLDLTSGFHQIPLSSESIEKTAFSTPYGHFEFTRMPFGLKNAPACFQRMMNMVLSDLIGKGAFVYLDDIVVYSKNLEEHSRILRKVLLRLKNANLKVQLDKSEFMKRQVDYLGHTITSEGVSPNLEKIKAIDALKEPKNQKEIKGFLGMIGYYRKFIRDFSTIASPLHKLLKKNVCFTWGEKEKHSFVELKSRLKNFTLLQYPDYAREFTITTDASNAGLGAVLSQEHNGRDLPIHFISRALNKAEVNYSTTEKECLAVVWAVQQFRPYIYGKHFKIKTDHRPLTWLFSVKNPGSRLIRWRLRLEEYQYEIIYKKGVDNVVADELSRNIVFPVEVENNDESERGIQENFGNDLLNTEEDLERLSEANKNIANTEEDLIRILEENYEENDPSNINVNENIGNEKSNISDSSDEFNSSDEVQNNNIQIIKDKEEQQKIIKDNHEGLIGGHGGQKATISRIREKFYWKGLNKDVIEYIKRCIPCQKQKINRHPARNPMNIVSNAEHCLERVSMDLTGPYKDGKKVIYSLTIQDDLSKYIKYIPIEGKKSETIARAFTNEWILYFGIPKYILTDNGGEFVNDLMKEICKLFKIKHIRTSSAYPQSNGSAERAHARLGEYLRLVIKDKTKPEYAKLFRYAAFCHNTTKHNSTGFTPHEMLFGRRANAPSEVGDMRFKTIMDYTQELQLKLLRMEVEAKKNLHKSKLKAKERYDKKLGSKTPDFKIHDLILVENEKREKSSEKYSGPFKITKILGDSVVIRRNNKYIKYNKSKIKHFIGQPPAEQSESRR